MKEKGKQKNKKIKQKTKTEKNEGGKSYGERVRAKWFCFAIKLGFIQLICKASIKF